jgi:hypothetical protein
VRFIKQNITNKTLYTSPYLVVNDQEYTKHFYAGSQRLASKLGAGLASSVVDPLSYQVGEITSSYENKRDSLSDLLARGWDCADIEAGNVSIESTEFNVINELAESSANEPESDLYFYHSDHLGSSSWITSASGCRPALAISPLRRKLTSTNAPAHGMCLILSPVKRKIMRLDIAISAHGIMIVI